METKELKLDMIIVSKINGVDILASHTELGLVPVKPICEALGVDVKAQREKLNSNPLYAQLGVLSTSVACIIKATAADGKERENNSIIY
jgi:hypothetical protein